MCIYIMSLVAPQQAQQGGRRRRRRSHRGGSYTSAATYGSYVNGDVNSQFARTFDQSGPYGANPSGDLIGAQGQNSTLFGAPSGQNLALVQSAGRRRGSHRRGSRSRRGGFMGSSAVPASLYAMYSSKSRRRKRGKSHRRSHRR